MKRKIAILISGRGTNMVALLEACENPDFPAEVALVLSNVPNAAGVQKASAMGIRTAIVDHRKFPHDREGFEAEMQERIEAAGADFVCLAGFMRLLTRGFTDAWSGRMINIHPSLLPSFPGLDTHARALEEGVRIHGCTVHFVNSEMDAGPIIAQAAVPVTPQDTPETLAARVLDCEHLLYPHALRMVLDGEAREKGEKVILSGEAAAKAPPRAILNPAL
jgi:phosphoribosylglycinamide formyltransferase-1